MTTAWVIGRILGPMRQRVAALVIALMVAGAPAALIACELLCAAPDGQPSHACENGQPAGTTSVTGAVHACGHDDALPEASGMVTPQSSPVAMVVAVMSPQPFHAQGAGPRLVVVASVLPASPTLKTQLRI